MSEQSIEDLAALERSKPALMNIIETIIMKSKVKGDSHPHDVSPHQAERSENDQAFLDLLNALKGLMALVDNGTLVRDTSKDHGTNWAIAQLPLIMALKNAQSVIDRVELNPHACFQD